MAHQHGVLKFKGRIGDLSFYKSSGKYMARTKGGVDADRIKNDPRFERTRENGREFLRAVKASKLLREAFRERLILTGDRQMSNRLTSEFSAVIKTDGVSARGDRHVMAGDITLLNGFDFNTGSGLDKVLSAQYGVEFTRATGVAVATIAECNPAINFHKPEGATHAQLVLIAGEFDFDGEAYQADSITGAVIELVQGTEPAQTLQVNLGADSQGVIVVMLGVMFFQQVNGELYKMNNGAKNALRIVHTEGVV